MANNTLRSFASGMVIATSIFTVVYFFQPAQEKEQKTIKDHALTAEEVEQYLDDKGYISIPKQTYDDLMKNEDSAEEENASAEDTAGEQNTPSNEPPASNESIETEEDNTTIEEPPVTNSVEEAVVENTETPIVEPKKYKLQIVPGMSGLQIGKNLQSAGIVRSGKEFSNFLASKNLQSKIQVGTYYLNSNMTYDQIGRIITTKK